MVNISIDVTDLGGEARPGDKVVLWKPAAAGSATHAGRVISTAPVDVFLTNGKASVPDVEPGEMRVLLQCRGVESQGPIDVTVPDGNGTVTLRSLIESQFEYSPPIVSAVQEAAANASASERAAIEAQVRSEAAADRADAKVDDAINNGANLVRDEVKQDADRAVSARQAATQSESKAKASENAAASSASKAKTSETNAKQSETNAGDYAAVATTAATEAVDAMEAAALSAAAFSIYTGTGSPERRVAAPVGSIYTDSAATNGAIRWIKTSGAENTGWKVEYGDTGWRNISSEVIEPWSGNVYMKRNFNTVEIRFEGVVRGANTYDVMNIASGFRPAILRGQGPRIVLHQADSIANQTRFRAQGDRVLAVESANTGPYYGLVSYLTDDPWPTTLPGTPF